MKVVEKNKVEVNEEKQVELCAIPKSFAVQKINEILADPTKKVVLEEYYMWQNILSSPVQVTNQEVTPE